LSVPREKSEAELDRLIEELEARYRQPHHWCPALHDGSKGKLQQLMEEAAAQQKRDNAVLSARLMEDIGRDTQWRREAATAAMDDLARHLAKNLRDRPYSSTPPAPAAAPEERRLVVSESKCTVKFDGRELTMALSIRRLLVMLAVAASKGQAVVPKRLLEEQLLAKNSGPKALADLVYKARQQLRRQIADKAEPLQIENSHGAGYWLTLPKSDIGVVD
jgi:DNA-binding response OmpR family regulator